MQILTPWSLYTALICGLITIAIYYAISELVRGLSREMKYIRKAYKKLLCYHCRTAFGSMVMHPGHNVLCASTLPSLCESNSLEMPLLNGKAKLYNYRKSPKVEKFWNEVSNLRAEELEETSANSGWLLWSAKLNTQPVFAFPACFMILLSLSRPRQRRISLMSPANLGRGKAKVVLYYRSQILVCFIS